MRCPCTTLLSQRPLLRDGQMPPLLDLLFEFTQLAPHPLRDSDPRHLETPLPGLPTSVRKPQKVERLRLAESPLLPLLGGEPPELDQPCLLGLQLQPEL